MKRKKNYFKPLKGLSDGVTVFLSRLDDAMKRPESGERGRQIAELCNVLDMLNDTIRYSYLGVDYRKDKKY